MRIEQRLKHLANENPNYSLLWAQWEFDKKLLARALNTISRDFPHYSLHDSSHSSTIITQIEKVIAPNIDKLTATDCWLFLESCYWHDAGMIITNDEKKRLLTDEAFRKYLDRLIDTDHELSVYANCIISQKDKNDLGKALSISNALTFLVADYFRIIHAERSGSHVIDPQKINVHSPRTSLIPQRLFNFVAQIVQCHGKERNEILNLAKYNDGMDANDYAHPRYIAALLRIGDLLDIDDGRFCPTLLANIGDLPNTSKDHQHKHASIKHLYIDSDIIEIKAECEQYGGYHAQQAWFNYIQDEFDYQKRVWSKIVPDSNFRALPTLGKIVCDIKGYIAIDGRVPAITLDPKRVYNYITGSQIYSELYPFVRELIQNSVDATYYKVWDDLLYDKMVIEGEDEQNRKLFTDELSKTKINVNLSECEVDGEYYTSFSVRDFGTGINLSDIKKILNVGSESTQFRKELLRLMPDWAKPAGYFGIGLQTVFKLCSSVLITTRMVDEPCYEINVVNKVSTIEISIKEIQIKRFYGTEVKALFKNNKNLPDFMNLDDKFLNYYDPLDENRFGFFDFYVKNIINNDFSGLGVNIYVNDKEMDEKKLQNDDDIASGIRTDYDLGVDFNLYIELDRTSRFTFKYKHVRFESRGYFSALVGWVNIFNKDSGYWLTIDRKKGRTDKYDELSSLIEKIIKGNLSYIWHNTPDKRVADLYLYARYDYTLNNEWENFEIDGIKLFDYLNGSNNLIAHNKLFYQTTSLPGVSIDDLSFILLGNIVNKLKISVNVERDEKTNIDKGIVIYRIDFTRDGLGRVNFPSEMISAHFNKRNPFNKGRKFILCFNEAYKDIAISRKDIPDYVFSLTPFDYWCDYALFLPRKDQEIQSELAMIFEFYKKKGLINIDEEVFKSLYLRAWSELDN